MTAGGEPVAPRNGYLEGMHPTLPHEVHRHLAMAEAALMLVESLMLALIEHRALTREQVVDAVEMVIETKRQIVADGSHPEIAATAAGLVTTIANSLAAAPEATPPAAERSPVRAGVVQPEQA